MARTLIERGFDPERIVKIYNGMDFDRPEGEFDRVAYLRDTYGAEIEDGDVLCGIACASDRRQGYCDYHSRLCRRR